LSADYKNIRIENYNYHLPDEKIAKYPKQERDESKLLVYNNGNINTSCFNGLPDLLQSDDLMVFNNAKVIQARLDFFKETGAHIEIFCLEPHEPADYNLAFQITGQCQWKCLVGNLKKWKLGKLIKQIQIDKTIYFIEASYIGKSGSAEILQFNWYLAENESNQNISFGDILENSGSTPLPPYLNRTAEEIDKSRYQTVYALQKGSVAAPTAGLHFTDNVLQKLKNKGIAIANITLHVSAGTFRPVKSATIEGHEMHQEHFEITRQTLKQIALHQGRVVAIGTTSARTLESIHRIGVKLIKKEPDPFHISQWEVYESPDEIDFHESFKAIIDYMEEFQLEKLQASTNIIIVPGYQFKTIKALVTNFHQPQSTLLLLIAAAVGEKWHEIYNFALANNYRFLSYGDSSLLVF
jgi:S-adenosylmethionine:tRNA ribosyltransferase-isomerase